MVLQQLQPLIASNGVVHVVDKVIGLPTIVTHALANLILLFSWF
jgi:hypothetical protein